MVGFNTQPPEGGWLIRRLMGMLRWRFNTQPPEGGWGFSGGDEAGCNGFNTQPPEGGWFCRSSIGCFNSSFNTQPPEGGWYRAGADYRSLKSFNTQPPEGGWDPDYRLEGLQWAVSTHSRLKAAGRIIPSAISAAGTFQHTAA